jgi:protein-S-isoprenylcysteine O-methyltransferase Ste14
MDGTTDISGSPALRFSAASLDTTSTAASAIRVPRLHKNFALRAAELLIFLLAVVGAVALGLGIADYLGEHPYLSAYLIAYAAFRIADLVVRDEGTLESEAGGFRRRLLNELPVLLVFAAAPFERTYFYGGEGPRWLAGLGLLIELSGLWLVLGARIQLGYFAAPEGDKGTLVRSGLYRFIRHPIFAGEFLVVLAWPFEYAAYGTLVLTLIIGIAAVRHRIKSEEAEMLAAFGDEYAAYMRETDSVIPNIW